MDLETLQNQARDWADLIGRAQATMRNAQKKAAGRNAGCAK